MENCADAVERASGHGRGRRPMALGHVIRSGRSRDAGGENPLTRVDPEAFSSLFFCFRFSFGNETRLLNAQKSYRVVPSFDPGAR